MAKLYTQIVKICSVIFVACVGFSIIFAVISPSCTLPENYAVGIACSSLLVIIPVILQYLSEMDRINKEMESSICSLVVHLSMGLYDELNMQQYKYIWSLLDEDFRKFYTCKKETAYFTKKQTQRHFKKHEEILREYLRFEAIRYTDDKNIIDYITNYDRFMRLANAAILIVKSDWEKEHIRKLIEMAESENHKHVNLIDQRERNTP